MIAVVGLRKGRIFTFRKRADFEYVLNDYSFFFYYFF